MNRLIRMALQVTVSNQFTNSIVLLQVSEILQLLEIYFDCFVYVFFPVDTQMRVSWIAISDIGCPRIAVTYLIFNLLHQDLFV